MTEAEYILPSGSLNEPMETSLDKLIVRCKAAHFTNVKVRINGEWEEYEADWIKSLIKLDRTQGDTYEHVLAKLQLAQRRLSVLEDHISNQNQPSSKAQGGGDRTGMSADRWRDAG